MKTTPIGTIDLGIDGRDFYVHLELDNHEVEQAEKEKLFPLNLVEALLYRREAFDGSGPGSLFCQKVSVMPFPHTENRFVGVIHIRRDI